MPREKSFSLKRKRKTLERKREEERRRERRRKGRESGDFRFPRDLNADSNPTNPRQVIKLAK